MYVWGSIQVPVNLYQEDTLRECSSVGLIQGVCLIQVSIKCHSNEQEKQALYKQNEMRKQYSVKWAKQAVQLYKKSLNWIKTVSLS